MSAWGLYQKNAVEYVRGGVLSLLPRGIARFADTPILGRLWCSGLQLGQVDLAHVQDLIACGGVGHEFGDVVGDDLP